MGLGFRVQGTSVSRILDEFFKGSLWFFSRVL